MNSSPAREFLARPRDDKVSGTIVIEAHGNGVQQPEPGNVDDSSARGCSRQRIDGRLAPTDPDTRQDLVVTYQCTKLRPERLECALDRDSDGVRLSVLGGNRVEVFGQLVD